MATVYEKIRQLDKLKNEFLVVTSCNKGLRCRRYVEYTFNHTHFCIYDNNGPVKPVYVKVLKEGESEYRVVAFFFY